MIDTSMVYIPSTAKAPEGAWDFAKYISAGAGAEIFVKEKGDLPAAKALTQDETVINSKPSYKVYLDIISKNNLYSLPPMSGSAEYDQNLRQAVSSVLLGNSVEDAKAQLIKSMANIE
jgi:ABC-type glycerol-3-phosphate transport system substrate-binding protein